MFEETRIAPFADLSSPDAVPHDMVGRLQVRPPGFWHGEPGQ